MFLDVPPLKTRMSVLYVFPSFKVGGGGGGGGGEGGGWGGGRSVRGVLGCIVVY